MRRAWYKHSQSKEVFEVSSKEFGQLRGLCDTLEDLTAEPSRTGNTHPDAKQPSKRRQLKQLRDEIRGTLSNIDAKLAEDDEAGEDEITRDARQKTAERMKLPIHLRGSAIMAAMSGK